MAPSFPRVFGKYILLKPVARGGMGELFLALAGELGGFEKLCVIKRVQASRDNPALMRRFADESKLVVKLSHGNLVQVFDAGVVQDQAYLAMEYVEGCDLRQVMLQCERSKAQIPAEVALYAAIQVLRGLHHAHTYGNLKLVHRDICPSNVLVSFSGEVKLTDFGVAQSVLKQEHTAPGTVYGRFAYLAPEQAKRQPVDARTDLYAMGIILWELLVGQPMRPADLSDPAQTLSQIRSAKVVPPSQRNPRVPRELDPVVIRALQSAPEQRFTTADEMRAELARVLARRNPAFDAGGLATFMRQIFGVEIDRRRKEREELLKQDLSHLERPTRPSQPGRPVASDSLAGARSSGEYMPPEERAPDGDEDLAGQVVDERYRVIRRLGEGGMGAVYEAEHMEIGRRVALKIMHAAYSSHPEIMARFRREARAVTRIGHPNIVEVTDSGATPQGRLYFVMELLDGIDLAQVMEQSRIVPARRALRVTLQICKALHAAHEVGIVHRDLKPENVFLIAKEGKGDFVKLLDFGIAKNLQSAEEGLRLTHPGMAMGTPEYMAPEQAAGMDIDRRIDVYATGAMLYEMLTGHLPHEGDNLLQVLSRKASEPVRPPRDFRPEMPAELEQILLRALANKPAERFADMEQLAEALLPFTTPGATAWAEANGEAVNGASPRAVDPSPAGAQGRAEAALANDPTLLAAVPLEGEPDSGEPARVVRAGDVRLSDDMLALERSSLPLGQAADAGDVAGRSVSGASNRRWLLLGAIGGVLVLGVVGALVLWPAAEPPKTASMVALDAGPAPDLAAPPPDSAPRPDTRPAKMTPQEVARLIEWARRAALGRRFTRPPGDNVRDLLARVEHDYPGHADAKALRERVCRGLRRSAWRARRKRAYERAERLLLTWQALDSESEAPREQLSRLHRTLARRALAARRYRQALQHAKKSRTLTPQSVAALELSGSISERRRQYARAAKYYASALELKPKSRRVRRRLARKLRRAKRRAR